MRERIARFASERKGRTEGEAGERARTRNPQSDPDEGP